MSVRKKGNRWEVRVRFGDGRRVERRLPLGASRTDALALEAQVRGDVVAASLGRFDYPLKTALDRWQIDAQRLKSWQRDLRYRAGVVRETYGERRLSELQKVADGIKEAGAKADLSAAGVNRYLAILRRLGRLAQRWGWLERAPEIEFVSGEKSRSVALTPAQLRRLVENADPRLAPMILFAALSGMRRGEQLALSADSIVDGQAIVSNSKTARPRAVPLPREALRIAKKHLPWAIKVANVRKLFDEARERARLPHVRWHDIRRTYGSWLVAGGAPLHAVRDLLGHGDVRTTSIYLATARQDLRDAIEALPKIPGQGRVKKKSTQSNADRNTGGVDGAGL